MKILKVLIIAATLMGGFFVPAFGAEFTVDHRSTYHALVGAGVGVGVGILETDEPDWQTYLAATGVAALAASAKEAGDGYWDLGDWVFTVVPAPIALWVENKVEVWIKDNMVGVRGRY